MKRSSKSSVKFLPNSSKNRKGVTSASVNISRFRFAFQYSLVNPHVTIMIGLYVECRNCVQYVLNLYLCFLKRTGLSAAKLLKANGLTPVVLEARDRVGGRTFTVRVRLKLRFWNCTASTESVFFLIYVDMQVMYQILWNPWPVNADAQNPRQLTTWRILVNVNFPII